MRVHSRAALVLLAHLLLASCGDESAPAATTPIVPAWAKVAPEQIAEAEKHGVPVAFENDLGMRFVLIPAGTFLMGSPHKEQGRDCDEQRQTVRLARPYYLQATEVTLGQYRVWKPNHENVRPILEVDVNTSDHPMWGHYLDVRRFARWVSKHDPDRAYRLPTEAEWEYACRAGTRSAYYWGVSPEGARRHEQSPEGHLSRREAADPDAPADSADGRIPVPVASFEPNPWGLHDMLGNATEWCRDFYAKDPWAWSDVSRPAVDPVGPMGTGSRVVKGCTRYGRDAGAGPRCATRTGIDPLRSDAGSGFRLVSPLPAPDEGGR